MLPQLKSSSLVSLGQICNDKCTVVINSNELVAAKTKDVQIVVPKNKVLFTGKRNFYDDLYDISITKTTIQPNNFIQSKSHCIYHTTTHTPSKLFQTSTSISLKSILKKKNIYHINSVSQDLLTTTINNFTQSDPN